MKKFLMTIMLFGTCNIAIADNLNTSQIEYKKNPANSVPSLNVDVIRITKSNDDDYKINWNAVLENMGKESNGLTIKSTQSFYNSKTLANIKLNDDIFLYSENGSDKNLLLKSLSSVTDAENIISLEGKVLNNGNIGFSSGLGLGWGRKLLVTPRVMGSGLVSFDIDMSIPTATIIKDGKVSEMEECVFKFSTKETNINEINIYKTCKDYNNSSYVLIIKTFNK